MTKAKNLNTNRVEWYTPKEVVDHFAPSDGFQYDPCTTDAQAAYLGIPHYDTKDTDGLTTDWFNYDSIWINPPFDHKAEFLKKAVDTYLNGESYICVLLPIEFLTTVKFHKIISPVAGDYFLHIPNGRIKFIGGAGASSPAFGSVVIELGTKSGGLKHLRLDGETDTK